jgi:hypothetical protein
MGISVSTHDTILDTFIRQATDAAERYCHRIFSRQRYYEIGPAYGGPYRSLTQAPAIVLHGVIRLGETITDVSVNDAAKGLLYRQNGFDWTAQRFDGLLGIGHWLDHGIPVALTEEPNWAFDYTAGFLVPADNLVSVSTVSVSAVDNSFNDSANGFPALLKAGDIIEGVGFSNAANNGRFVVTGTPTTSKITVDAALTNENAAAGRSLLLSNLPGDVERGAIEIVKSLFALRSTAGSIVEKAGGSMRIRYSEGQGDLGLPPTAIGYLNGWVRTV